MHLSARLLEKLSLVAMTISRNPTAQALCSSLSLLVCPLGEVSRVWMGSLHGDGIIRPIAAFGYPVEKNVMSVTTPITWNSPMPKAIISKQVVFGSQEELRRDFPDYVPCDLDSPWKSSAFVPTPSSAYVFHLQSILEDYDVAKKYFTALGNILSLYSIDIERSGIEKKDGDSVSFKRHAIRGTPLTDRQEEILQQIRRGMTNVAIAREMGYSESLIRHETIIIYAKLNVRGRKELIGPNQDDLNVSGEEKSRESSVASSR